MSVINGGFARNRTATAAIAGTEARPKVNVWINLGYYLNEGTDDEVFVGLPTGIALDTMQPVSTRSSNPVYAQLQAAKNEMLAQFLEQASSLQPGEAHIIRTDGPLCIQIRRINDEQAEPAVDDSNPFVQKLFG